MYKEKYKVKYLSRKVILAWKKASEASTISWREVFPIICALYELDDNLQNDKSFRAVDIEKIQFYKGFQELLEQLNITHHNLHYFRKLTKHLLKTYLEVNQEVPKLQEDTKSTDKQETIDNSVICPVIPVVKSNQNTSSSLTKTNDIIPKIIVDELINFYVELKKADGCDSKGKVSKTSKNHTERSSSTDIPVRPRRHHLHHATPVKNAKSQPKQIQIVMNDDVIVTKETKPVVRRRPLPPIPNKSPVFSTGKISPLMRSPNLNNMIVSPSLRSPKFSYQYSPQFSSILTPNDSSYLNKPIVPPSVVDNVTMKSSTKPHFRKTKKNNLMVSTNYILNNYSKDSSLLNEHESSSPNGSISPHSASSQNSFRIDDNLFMSSLPTKSNNNNNNNNNIDSQESPTTSATPNSISTLIASVYGSPPYTPTRSSSIQPRRSMNSMKINSHSNRFEEFLLNGKVNYSPNISYAKSPSISPALSYASSDNGFSKDNIYNYKFNNYHKKSNGNPHHQNGIHLSPQKIFSNRRLCIDESLPSIPSINFNDEIAPTKPRFTQFEEPLPAFPLPPVNHPNSPSLSQQSQSQSQSQNQINYSFSQSQLISDSSFSNCGMNMLEDQQLLEEDTEISNILNQYHPSFSNSNSSVIGSPNLTYGPVFKNNHLTKEGAKYANQHQKPYDSLEFIEEEEEEERERRRRERNRIRRYKKQMKKDEKEKQRGLINDIIKEEEEEGGYHSDNGFDYRYEYDEDDSSDDDNGQTSTIITDTSVIDSLECDLLNHRFQRRKSSAKSSNMLKSEISLASINETNEANVSDDTMIEDEERKLTEKMIKNEIDENEKSTYFRLSFLTSKSSCHTLKRKLRNAGNDEQKEEKEEKEEEIVQSSDMVKSKLKEEIKVEEEINHGDETKVIDEINHGDETKVMEEISNHGDETRVMEEISNHGDETKVMEEASNHGDETKVMEETSNHGDETKVMEEVTNHEDETRVMEEISNHGDETKVMEEVTSNEDETKVFEEVTNHEDETKTEDNVKTENNENNEVNVNSNNKEKPSIEKTKESKTMKSDNKTSSYFVHPIQLYNIIQMIYVYSIPKLPKSARAITKHWMSISNEMALTFWNLLKKYEETISNVVIYATFYDQVKDKTISLQDPNHEFLKELISITDITQNTTTSLLEDNDIYRKEFDFSDEKIFKSFENPENNTKLIMEIKRQLLI